MFLLQTRRCKGPSLTIDGWAALALAVYFAAQDTTSVYETRGVVMV